jgi:hypothetical protein
MKEYTVSYSTKDSSTVGTFVRSYPTPEDLELNPSNSAQISMYWAAFRQWLVTDRATAKRLRKGNDTNPPRTEAEVAALFKNAKMPKYAEPTEQVSPVVKEQKATAAALIEALLSQGKSVQEIVALMSAVKDAAEDEQEQEQNEE